MGKLKELLQNFSSFEGSLFRYSLAFSFLLALLPMLIVIVMLFHNSILDIDALFEYIYRFVPEDLIGDFVNHLIEQEYPTDITLLLSLITAFHLASRSIYSFMLISAQNEGYNIPKFLIRIKSYMLFTAIVISAGAIGILASIFHSITWPMLAGGLFLLFFLFYRILTFEKKPISYGLFGAGFATLSIGITGKIFLFLVNYFTSYNILYGPMASLVIALLSIYTIASLVYFGYCLNVVYGATYAEVKYKHEGLYNVVLDNMKKLKKWIKERLPYER